jgi:hypothetical protein
MAHDPTATSPEALNEQRYLLHMAANLLDRLYTRWALGTLPQDAQDKLMEEAAEILRSISAYLDRERG